MSDRPLPSAGFCALIAVFFFIVTFAVYGGSLRNEFVTWDDVSLIQENPNVKSMNLTTIKNVFTSYDPELYIPLTFVSYQVDHAIGGRDPAIYHITNIVLHTFNALLVAWVLYLLLGSGVLAVGLGLLFALHPLNTEAAVWMSARKDTLSTFFFLLSLVSYCLWRARGQKNLYLFSIAAFLCGLLSKVMIVTLPLVLLLVDALERRPFSKRSVLEKWPYFALSFVFGIVALFGKSSMLVESTTWQKVLMAGKSTVSTLQKFFVPTGLSVMYPYEKSITFGSADFFIPFFLTALLVALSLWLWNRKRAVSVGLFFFLITLVPTFTNFAKGGDLYIASDRYAYVPMIGLLLALGSLVSEWLVASGGLREYRSRRHTVIGATLIVLMLCAWRSAVQTSVWRTSEELYLNVLRYQPSARAAHNNLGMEYLRQRKTDEALKSFDRSLEIRRDPRTRANKAAALVQKGLLDEALKEFQAMISLAPDLPEGYYGIGNILQRRGQIKEAVEMYQKALLADPSYTNALNNLGASYILLEDWDNAIAILKRSTEAQPDFVESYYNLAGAYERKGMRAEAEAMYRKSWSLSPSDPDTLASLAVLVYDRGEIDEAATLLRMALQIQGNNPIAIDLVLRMKKDGVAE